jgi:hypothetical protein
MAALALLLSAAPAHPAKKPPRNPWPDTRSIAWPPGTEVLRFENIEGIILVAATLHGGAGSDTTGPLVLDTGAGYLALDVGLARILGLLDSSATVEAVGLARHPLPRLTLGRWSLAEVEPVLTVEGEVVRRVSDRPVLGLIGQHPLRERAVWIDYRDQTIALVPGADEDLPDTLRVAVEPGAATAPDSEALANPSPAQRDSSIARSRARLAPALSSAAVPVFFRLAGDGKILVRGRVSDPSPPRYSRTLNLLVDTGATKCVLFEDALAPGVTSADRWPAMRGLSAPTLIGTVPAWIARVPAIEIDAARQPLRTEGVDVGVIRSDLSQVLSRVTRETIHGLIGYSFLKRFRLALDYPNRVLWLDPIPGYRDDRPLEYCHVGLQLERHEGAVVVIGVVENSPAAQAGISPGDVVVALDGVQAETLDLLALSRRMEGEPGRPLTLVVSRDAVERTVKLVRRRLL